MSYSILKDIYRLIQICEVQLSFYWSLSYFIYIRKLTTQFKLVFTIRLKKRSKTSPIFGKIKRLLDLMKTLLWLKPFWVYPVRISSLEIQRSRSYKIDVFFLLHYSSLLRYFSLNSFPIYWYWLCLSIW